MNTFFHILWFKNLMFWKVSSKRDFGTVIKNLGSVVVFGSFAVGAFYFSNFITAYLLEDVKIGLFLFHRFVGMLLFVFFVTINLGNMVVSFSTLYRTPEVNFLLTSPVSYLNIFIIKFLDNFFYSSGTLFMVGFSVLLGYGFYFGMPWHFYLLMMFGVLVPFMFLAACIAVIVLLVLMKLASKVNFRLLVGGIVLFYIGQIYFYFQVSSPVHLVREVMKYYPYVDLYFGSLDPVSVKLLPNFWVSEIMYFYVTKNFSAVTGYTALLLLSTIGLFVIALAIANAIFYSTWITSLSIKSLTVKPLEFKNTFFSFGKPSVFSPQTEVVLKKEFWQFIREPSQWIHFVVMMALLLIFLSSVSTLNIKLDTPELKAVVYLVVFVFNIFLINSLALRFGFPMMSLEGSAYWSLRSAPITTTKVYWIKFTIIVVFLGILSIIISWLSNIPYLYLRKIAGEQPWLVTYIEPSEPVKLLAYFSMIVTPIITVTLVSLNFGLGSVYSNFIEKNPIRIASSQGATMTFLLSVVYLVLLLAVYYFPATMLFTADVKELQPDWRMLKIVFAAVVIPSVLIIAASHAAGIRSLKRDY
ncbi:MAG: putative ABC transporter permease subunit [Bacteroidota bacterium]